MAPPERHEAREGTRRRGERSRVGEAAAREQEQAEHGGRSRSSGGVRELKDALLDTLEARGALAALRAHVRAEVYAALGDVGTDAHTHNSRERELSAERLLVQELVRDYLVHAGLRHTLAVFLAESGQPRDALARDILASELVFPAPPRSEPLLAGALRDLRPVVLSTTTAGPELERRPPLRAPTGMRAPARAGGGQIDTGLPHGAQGEDRRDHHRRAGAFGALEVLEPEALEEEHAVGKVEPWKDAPPARRAGREKAQRNARAAGPRRGQPVDHKIPAPNTSAHAKAPPSLSASAGVPKFVQTGMPVWS